MKQSIFVAFREKSFLFLWIGEVFTQVSVNLFNLFLLLTVFRLTNSNTAVSGVVLTFTLPAILFGILAGVYVDYWNKKRVLVITNILRALLMLILSFAHTNLILIYSISFLVAFLTQFFIPAETPIIPLIVKKENLYSANALFGLAIYGSLLIAYMISSTILLSFGEETSLFIFSGLLILGAISTTFVSSPNLKNAPGAKLVRKLNIRNEITTAFTMIRKTRQIYHSLFLLAFAQILILILAVIMPGYASQVLNIQVEKFPLLFITPAAIGMLAGALILINRFQDIAKEKIVIVGLFLSGISMLLLPFGPVISSKDVIKDLNEVLPHLLTINGIHLLVVLAFLLGLANSFVFVPSNTILLENTTDANRGKLYGALNAIVGIFSFLPLIVVGGLADLIGVSRVITGMGICLLFIGGYQYVIHRKNPLSFSDRM